MRNALRNDDSTVIKTILVIAITVLTVAVLSATPASAIGDDPSIDAVLNDSDYNNTGEIGVNDSATFEINLTDINDSEVSTYSWLVQYVPNVFDVTDEQVVSASTTTSSGDTFNLSNSNVTNITQAVANDTSTGGGETDITDNVSLNDSSDQITVNYALNSSEELLISYEYENVDDDLVVENFRGKQLTYNFDDDVPHTIIGRTDYLDSNSNPQNVTDSVTVLDADGSSTGTIDVGDNSIGIVPLVGGVFGVLTILVLAVVAVSKN